LLGPDASPVGKPPRGRDPVMLDIRMLRHDPGGAVAALERRGEGGAAGAVVAVAERDRERREALGRVNDLKALRNRVSKEIGEAKRRGGDAAAEIARMREVGAEIAQLDEVVSNADAWIAGQLALIPNLPDARVPAGGEEANRIVRTWGRRPSSASSRAPTGNWASLWTSSTWRPGRRCRVRASSCSRAGGRRCSGG